MKEGYEVKSLTRHYSEQIDFTERRSLVFSTDYGFETSNIVYTFDKSSQWSNGDPLTKEEFESIKEKLKQEWNKTHNNCDRKFIIKME